MEYTLMHKNLPVAQIEIDEETGSISKIIEIFHEEHLPVGTVYRQEPIRFVTDRNGIQWQLLNDNIDPITVKEDNRENEIVMTYEVAKAEISVRYKDTEGHTIKKTDLFNLEVGREFIPEVEREFVDEQNRRWLYNRTEPIKLTVGSINNIIKSCI